MDVCAPVLCVLFCARARLCVCACVFTCMRARHLGERLEHRDEDELDEADLRRRFRHLLPVHERRHRQPLLLLPVTLWGGQRSL